VIARARQRMKRRSIRSRRRRHRVAQRALVSAEVVEPAADVQSAIRWRPSREGRRAHRRRLDAYGPGRRIGGFARRPRDKAPPRNEREPLRSECDRKKGGRTAAAARGATCEIAGRREIIEGHAQVDRRIAPARSGSSQAGPSRRKAQSSAALDQRRAQRRAPGRHAGDTR